MSLAFGVSCDADAVINSPITFLRSRSYNFHHHHMTPMASSITCDNDARTGTSTGTKSHIISLTIIST